MPPHGSLASGACAVCRQSTTKWCSGCMRVFYCSRDHMLSDWPQHRAQCSPSTAANSCNMIAMPLPAEPEYVLVHAILFKSDEDRPRIISVNCNPPQRPSHGLCPVPLLRPYFDAPPDNIVLTQNLSGETLRFPLQIFYSATALNKASPINHSIINITSGAASKPWCGNVVVLKFTGSRCQGYTNASDNDLPPLSVYFISYK
ncbi:Hif prolyl hydroxylase [Mycena venus]|uniref:Hif prolyl hydroxylase n=1 Tax=Mycena venus TaxID=2733690 RepID=A0A8H6Z679_9AGAR|nr:Hif prolyl hydroxylase [Mycena venus]